MGDRPRIQITVTTRRCEITYEDDFDGRVETFRHAAEVVASMLVAREPAAEQPPTEPR